MIIEKFGEEKIFRPSIGAELRFRAKQEAYIRVKYAPGEYNSPQEINEILHYIINFLDHELRNIIKKVSSRNFIEFVLMQYDESCKIRSIVISLPKDRQERWKKLGPTFRRAIKYIAELATIYQPTSMPTEIIDKKHLLELTESAFICAEQLFEFCAQSDSTFYLFPDETTFEISPPGYENYLSFNVTNGYYQDMRKRVHFDAENNKYIYQLNEIPTYNVKLQEDHLNSTLKTYLGFSYSELLACLRGIIDNAKPAERCFVPFCQAAMIIEQLHNVSGLSEDIIQKIIDGFSLKKDNLELRKPFKPKQEYRAMFRSFFLWQWDTVDHYVWSPRMAQEAYLAICRNAVFGNLPQEWSSSDVEKALSRLNNYAGKWFERTTQEQIVALGYTTIAGVKRIRHELQQIEIPSDGVGEIDIIGYSPKEKLLLIVECKMVKEGFEPIYFRDSLTEFVTNRKSYAVKFRNKVSWIRKNFLKIKKALETEATFPDNLEIENIATIMVTFAPCFAKYFISDFPCIGLTEFVFDYKKLGQYPYELGKYQRESFLIA